MNEGKLDDSTVTCPWHGAQFNVCTGAVLRGPAAEPIKTYRVNVEREIGRVEGQKLMETSNTVRHYVNDAIDISYDARRCIHAAECIRGLPAVFESTRRPWIMPSATSANEIANVIAKCPSGALHFTRRDGGPSEVPQDPTTIVPTPRGPYYVRGLVQLRSADGSFAFEDVRIALCRCGQSGNKPFCDNSHRRAGFEDPGSIPKSDGSAENK